MHRGGTGHSHAGEKDLSTAVAQLGDLIGEHRVSVHPADLHRHAVDRSPSALIGKRAGANPLPLCVVRPHTTEQVADILKWAQSTKTAVVPYGGGSGVCEAIRSRDLVVIELRALEEILDFDEKSRLVRVQAGVTGPDLAKGLRSWGYQLGHEPQSISISTVGGWVATRACGQLSSRYGGIEDLISGLEAVLPGGLVVRSKPSPRRSAGPDVASLMIGSEGTLGIVTEVTMRVSHLARDRIDLCVRFPHLTDGVDACRKLAQSDLRPTLVRLYDTEDAQIFLRHHPDEKAEPLLLLSFDGHAAEDRCAEALVLTEGSRGNPALVSHWWDHRNDAVEEFENLMAGEGILGPHACVDTMEVSGTWSNLRALYHGLKESLGEHADIVGCHLSHVYGDGSCLYFTMASSCKDDIEALEKLDTWWNVGMEECLKAGGSISHHHGIGRRKASWLKDELGGWWDVLAAVKLAVDPDRIMNPGALGL